MEINLDRLQELYEQEDNITKATKKYCQETGTEYSDNLRRTFSNKLNKLSNTVDNDLDNGTETDTNQYGNDREKDADDFFMPSAWDTDKNRFLNIDEYCDKYGLPKEQVRSSKLVAHLEKHMIYNIAFNPTIIGEATGIDENFIESVVKKHIIKTPVNLKMFGEKNWFDRLVYTDVHTGMSTEGGRNVQPLYDDIWNEEQMFLRLDKLINHLTNHKKGSTLYIDDLGDYVDGLFGQTTRKGHELPQNMSDKEVFEIGVRFKVKMIDDLLSIYDRIVLNNITEDNHSGVFGYFVNSTVKKIVESKYPDNVEYNIFEKFINHYSVGKHTFVLTHGKDSESLKFGFKPILDAKQIEKIDQYCKEYNLYNGNFIEFSKGDSHQYIFDDSTSNDFSYYNYPAFSPPSNWVKSNFGKSKSGFVFFNIDMNSQLKIKIPYIF